MSNNWDGKGLPPVGCIVEYSGQDGVKENCCYDSWKNGDRLEVVAIKKVGYRKESIAIVFNLRTEDASGMNARYLKPVKSDRDKDIEELVDLWEDAWSNPNIISIEEAFGILYDAGFRKQSGE